MTNPIKKQTIALQEFNKIGYYKVPAVFECQSFTAIFKVMCDVYNKEAVPLGHEPLRFTDRNSCGIDAAFIQLREENPTVFSKIYDTCRNSLALYQLLLSPSVTDLVELFSGDEISKYLLSGVQLRMDMPDDIRNNLGWHQDRSYHQICDNGADSIIVWIPIQDVNDWNGTIKACVSSYVEGFVKVDVSNHDKITSGQYAIPNEIVGKYEQKSIEAKQGDVVLMNFDTIHQSGINRSDKVRFTLIGRFHKLMAESFHPCRVIFDPLH